MLTNNTHSGHAPSPENKLTCQQTIGVLVDYVAGDMEPASLAAFEAHLRDCPECTAFLRTYQETIRATRSVRYETVPAEMLARMQRFLRTRIKHPPPQS